MRTTTSFDSVIQWCQVHYFFDFYIVCCNPTEKVYICEISIIIIMICQKLESVEPIQQKIKLPSPNDKNYESMWNNDIKQVNVIQLILF